MLQEMVDRMEAHIAVEGKWGRKLVLRVCFDKAVDSTRLSVSLANIEKCNSNYNFWLLGKFC